MQDEFQTVVDINKLGGNSTPPATDNRLSPHGIAAMMSGPNQMGPGMLKKTSVKEGELPPAKLEC